MGTFLDSNARSEFEKAVAAIEATSAVEVVVAVRRCSSIHLHAHVVAGATATAIVTAYMLFSASVFGLWALLLDPLLVGAAVGLSVEFAPWLKRLLTPRAHLRDVVRRQAQATFLQRRVHATRGRSGLLVYVSLVERAAVVVADIELETGWTDGERAVAERALTAAIAGGGVAVATALGALVQPLSVAMPRTEGDVNELPDAIHAKISREWTVPARWWRA